MLLRLTYYLPPPSLLSFTRRNTFFRCPPSQLCLEALQFGLLLLPQTDHLFEGIFRRMGEGEDGRGEREGNRGRSYTYFGGG